MKRSRDSDDKEDNPVVKKSNISYEDFYTRLNDACKAGDLQAAQEVLAMVETDEERKEYI